MSQPFLPVEVTVVSVSPDIVLLMDPSLQQQLSATLPISLRYIRDLANRVSLRYTFIPRYKTIIIVKAFFETLRYLLVIQHTITLRSLFTNLKIGTYINERDNKYKRTIITKLTTSKELQP